MSCGRLAKRDKFSPIRIFISFGFIFFGTLLFDYNSWSKEFYGMDAEIAGETLSEELPKHAKDCVSFFSQLNESMVTKIGRRNCRKALTNLTLIGAYAYSDYSVVTIDSCQWYGRKVYCHYFDADWKELGPPVESVVFPEFAVHCCRHPRAAYMGLTESEDEEVNFTVPILDRTVDKPKYNLSVCLAPMYGNESKWLMLAELIEHYKLQGVQHVYLYVKDIDDYSRLLIDDYERSGEVEVVYLRKEQDRYGMEWHMVGVEECLHRSRHHSRYAIFTDIDERIMALGNQTLAEYTSKAMTEKTNIGMLQFRQTWVLRPRKPPNKYEGEVTLKKHLPTLIFHNTSAVGPRGHTVKCIIDPRRVLIMWIHYVLLYFPGYKGVTVSAPPDKAIIRHYRDLVDDNWGTTWIHEVERFGNFTMTDYPAQLMVKLYRNVKKRLSRVYGRT
ncbi:unnamed protein product [Cylicocyclus nassatus]|uniref:Glycosyltransferase family 92 protein n=1 Tax=Cylicocyclus nassatus TaxID=53992 RepID=A0AA36MBT9_CYLNA|nr:unnamed protein product [Cylicocyclus nassatus]